MQLTVYFLNKNLHCITLTINGVEYCTADNRITRGDESEVCICTSKTYAKDGNISDLDADMDLLIAEGIVEKREIDVEPTETEWKEWGISYTLVKHPKLIY
jgi:hypothetical protein